MKTPKVNSHLIGCPSASAIFIENHCATILSTMVPFFFLLLYLLPLGMRDLWSPDELRYAEIAREMVHSGNWVVPTFNDLRYFEKPIMGHWLNAVAQLVFGGTNFATRIASVLSVLGTVICLFKLVRGFATRQLAWGSSAIFLSLFLVSNVGSYNVLDSMFNFFLTATFSAFFFGAQAVTTQKRWRYYTAAGLGCGCALLTKGFIALALPVLVVLPFMFWQKQFRRILTWGWWVILLTVIVTLPWALAIHQAEPDYWHYFFWVEHVQRFASDNAQHSEPVWYYLPFLLLSTIPWVFVAPTAFKHLQGEFHKPLLRYALLWAVLPFLFFSAAKGKLVTYLLPCMAPIAILLAHGLSNAVANKAKGIAIGSVINGIAISMVGLGVITLFYTGGLPLDADEYYRVWLFTAICGIWALLAFSVVKVPSLDAKMSCYTLMPLSFFIFAWVMIPNVSIDSKMPGRFMTQVQPLAADDAILIADHPSTMSALNWYLKRTDVYLTANRGEVAYGLDYDDAKHRFIELSKLNDFIVVKRMDRPVLVMFRESDIPEGLPKPTRRLERGRYTLFYYQQPFIIGS